jgi:hypothetical protein
MKNHEDSPPAGSIHVGNVQGTGITIGHGSSTSVELTQPPTQQEAIALLDEFIRSLARHENAVADAADVRKSAAAAKAELAGTSPRWQVVRTLLRKIAKGVAGVAVLAEAISNIQAIVAHLPS